MRKAVVYVQPGDVLELRFVSRHDDRSYKSWDLGAQHKMLLQCGSYGEIEFSDPFYNFTMVNGPHRRQLLPQA